MIDRFQTHRQFDEALCKIHPKPLFSWRSHALSLVLLVPSSRSKFINVNEVFLKRSHSSENASCLEDASQSLLIVALTRRYMRGTVARLVYVQSNSPMKFFNLLAHRSITLQTMFIEFKTFANRSTCLFCVQFSSISSR